jgi:transposase
MTVQHACCAGLDVHQKTVVVCLRRQREAEVTYTEQTFGTTTRELCALGDWLIAQGCTHAVLEATGVYWKPVWYVLEARLTLLLAYAAAVRQLKGRKSDASDAHWLADLLAHGLIQPSYVPPPAIRELRDLTRTRHQLVQEVAQHTQRIQKVLEDASIKLATVVTDTLGVSGRAVIRGLIAGERNPSRLADAVDRRVRAGRAALEAAFDGRCTPHHEFLLQLHLDQIDTLERTIARVEARIAEQVAPFRATLDRLMTVPGIKETVARVILAEIGPDVSRFATAGHLISWAHLCSRRDESAGKRRSTRTLPGHIWLKTTLIQAAWAAVKRRDSYLHAQFVRLRARRGAKKAIVAVAASMLGAIYYMLQRDVPYHDLGADYFVRRNRERRARHLQQQLQALGYDVSLRSVA